MQDGDTKQGLSKNPIIAETTELRSVGEPLGSNEINWDILNDFDTQNIPDFIQADINIMNHSSDWYSDGIIDNFNKIIHYQITMHGYAIFIYMPITAEGMNNDYKLYPGTGRFLILQMLVNNNHFLIAKLSYRSYSLDPNEQIATIEIADSQMRPEYVASRINFVLNNVKEAFVETPGNKIKVVVLNVQQQPQSHRCGPFSILNTFYFAMGKDPQKYEIRINALRPYIARCGHSKKFLPTTDIKYISREVQPLKVSDYDVVSGQFNDSIISKTKEAGSCNSFAEQGNEIYEFSDNEIKIGSDIEIEYSESDLEICRIVPEGLSDNDLSELESDTPEIKPSPVPEPAIKPVPEKKPKMDYGLDTEAIMQ